MKATNTQTGHPKNDLDLSTPVDELRGISDTYRRRLARLGAHKVEDLLYLLPHRYDDFSALKTISQLEYGEEVTIVGTVWESSNRRTRSGHFAGGRLPTGPLGCLCVHVQDAAGFGH